MNHEKASKKRRLLTIFDIIIIVVVIAIGGGIYYFTSSGGASSGESGTVRYTIELNGMEYGAADLIKPGDSLKDNIKKYAIGTVVSVEKADTVITYIDYINGGYVSKKPQGQVTALILVEAPCVKSETGAVVDNGFKVRCGTSVAVSGPGYAGSGYVVAVERGE